MSPSVRKKNDERIEKLRHWCSMFWVETEDPSFSSTEDLAPYLEGEERVDRYVTITEANTAEGGTIRYAYPRATRADARRAATANVQDNIYPESPVAIIDLDTGVVRRPRWANLTWEVAS